MSDCNIAEAVKSKEFTSGSEINCEQAVFPECGCIQILCQMVGVLLLYLVYEGKVPFCRS